MLKYPYHDARGADGAEFRLYMVPMLGVWEAFYTLRLAALPTRDLWRPDMSPAEYRVYQEASRPRPIGEWPGFRPAEGTRPDSAGNWEAAWGFVTLREGDTDREYFNGYTPDMLAWRDTHAEAVACYLAELWQAIREYQEAANV